MAISEMVLKNNELFARAPRKHKGVSYGKWGLIFIIPFILAYAIFTLIPQVVTIGYSFIEYYEEGLTVVGPNFAGFDNYVALFTPNANGYIEILRFFGNTMILWLIGAIPQFAVALFLSVLFTSTRLRLKFTGLFKTIFYLPNVIMASAFALLIYQVFSDVGPINAMITSSGGTAFKFLDQEVTVRSLIALMNYLMWFGNTTLVLMAGIQGIDESVFESARIDGANAWQVFKDMTMPLLKPIFIYCLITSLIGGLQMFDVPQILTDGHGTPDFSSTTMVMYLNMKIGGHNYGLAGAVSVLLFFITGVLSVSVFRLTGDRNKQGRGQ
jgi:ABC-type sugar transport systems, permease components